MTSTSEFQSARFSIDSLPETIFEGFTTGETWNGWACPYFTHKVAVTVLEASRNNGYLWSYDVEADAFEVHLRRTVDNSEGPVPSSRASRAGAAPRQGRTVQTGQQR